MGIFIPIENQLKRRGFKFVVGIDEVGRGPLAGPVVSAAVILKEKARLPGLADSKQLSKAKREKLFWMILDNALDYCIAAVPHTLIDEINILNATRIANDLCINELSIKPDIAIIDGRDKQILNIPFLTFIKGDRHIRSIAAASILAKVFRDTIMQEYGREFPQYGFEKHVGYGTRLHRANILKHGFCDIHRRSYTVNYENCDCR